MCAQIVNGQVHGTFTGGRRAPFCPEIFTTWAIMVQCPEIHLTSTLHIHGVNMEAKRHPIDCPGILKIQYFNVVKTLWKAMKINLDVPFNLRWLVAPSVSWSVCFLMFLPIFCTKMKNDLQLTRVIFFLQEMHIKNILVCWAFFSSWY